MLTDVTEFMYDDVVPKTLGEEREPVIEVQVPAFRAAAPTRLLLPDRDTAVLNAVDCAPIHKTRMDVCA